jgi:hypothetical protein
MLLPEVEVAQQRDFGAVVQHLPVDVQDELCHGRLRPWPLGRAAGPGQPIPASPVRAQPADARDPGRIGVIELGERRGGVAGIAVGFVLHRWAAEVGRHPHAEHADDDVPEPPGDRGHRRRYRRRDGEVDHEVACAHLDRCGPGSAGPDIPRAGHRLPAVFRVGHRVQPRPQLLAPVRVQLLSQLEVPVNISHAATLGGDADRSRPH